MLSFNHIDNATHLVEYKGKRPGHRGQEHHADADDPYCLCPKPACNTKAPGSSGGQFALPRVPCSTSAAKIFSLAVMQKLQGFGCSPQAVSTAECLRDNLGKDDNEHCKTG
jgi:hypothetical protein